MEVDNIFEYLTPLMKMNTSLSTGQMSPGIMGLRLSKWLKSYEFKHFLIAF